MSTTLLIARRELSAYMRTLSGYVIIALMLGVDGLLFNAFVLGTGSHRSSEVLGEFFRISSFFVGVAAVFIAMRVLAEERQQGTITLLYSSPVRDAEIVAGKFLSALGFLSILLLVSVYMPALIFVNGKVSLGHIAAGYLGLLLFGSACLAITVFGSALAKSQIVAGIVGGAMVVGMLVPWMLARVTERPLTDIFNAMGLWNDHFQPFEHGIVHARDVIYYVVVTYVALFAATRVLEARRWR